MGNVVLPIANGFYVSDSLPISAQRCVNWQPNVVQTSSITDANLFVTPGLIELAKVSDIKSCRGAHVMNEIPYFVIGQNLYRLNRVVVDGVDTFTTDDLGTIDGVERVTIADNGLEMCIVAKPDALTVGRSYIFTDDPDTLTQITDINFDGPAGSVVYIDGFFNFIRTDGKKFFNSPLASGLGPYDPLDFSTASADPDQIRVQAIFKNQLYIIGSETIEIFRNIGRSPAPFQRIQGAVNDLGIFAVQSIQLFSDALIFVGGSVNQSPAIWVVVGAGKKKISTISIDNELSKLTSDQVSRVFSWTYAESGAFFYGLTLPNTTFVYDSINQRWHERQTITAGDPARYRVSHMVTAYGRILVGDLEDGRIGQLQEGTYTEYDDLVRRFVTSQPFDNSGKPLFVGSIEAVCEAGVGLTSNASVNINDELLGLSSAVEAGIDPLITLAWSDDGGRNFIGFRSRSMGKKGEFKRRQIWRKLGRFPRSRVLLFEVTSPTKATLIKVEADVQ